MTDNKILLVEDNPDSVRLTLRMLAEYHLANNIQVAYDGAQALDYLLTQDEDLPQKPFDNQRSPAKVSDCVDCVVFIFRQNRACVGFWILRPNVFDT